MSMGGYIGSIALDPIVESHGEYCLTLIYKAIQSIYADVVWLIILIGHLYLSGVELGGP